MPSLPLTRAANLCDFDGVCPSVAAWQQQHARDAFTRWLADHPIPKPRAPQRVCCTNWGAARFTAPSAVLPVDYQDHGHDVNGLPAQGYAAIYALSVLDRADMPVRVLRSYHTALAPHGLLVATFALWDATGPDCALGCELRRRIYDRLSWTRLIADSRALGFRLYGGVDLRYPGDALGDHTLAALTLVKGA